MFPDSLATPDPLLTAREVGEWLGLSSHRVLDLAQAGKITSLKLPSGAVRFRRTDIEKLIEASVRLATA